MPRFGGSSTKMGQGQSKRKLPTGISKKSNYWPKRPFYAVSDNTSQHNCGCHELCLSVEWGESRIVPGLSPRGPGDPSYGTYSSTLTQAQCYIRRRKMTDVPRQTDQVDRRRDKLSILLVSSHPWFARGCVVCWSREAMWKSLRSCKW